MEEVVIFALKCLLIVLSLGALIILVAVMAARANNKSELEVEPVHKQLRDLGFFLKSFTLSKSEQKAEKKKRKAEEKEQAKKDDETDKGSKLFVIDFNGDVQASQVENLREEITAVLQLATPKDEVLVKVESPGGVVHGYGLCASQLRRLRERQIPLTISVDKVAASGGYMMACVANQILSAPFAIVGSIGVVAQVPNLYRLLKKHDVDYKEYTAGDYKRTVSLLGEITPKGEQKFLEQLQETHELFKQFVSLNRPQAKINDVATGEHWYGERAMALGLVDRIITSDDYILQAFTANRPIYAVKYEKKRALGERLSGFLGQLSTRITAEILEFLQTRTLP